MAHHCIIVTLILISVIYNRLKHTRLTITVKIVYELNQIYVIVFNNTRSQPCQRLCDAVMINVGKKINFSRHFMRKQKCQPVGDARGKVQRLSDLGDSFYAEHEYFTKTCANPSCRDISLDL